jgi:hypothetical protein
MTGRGAGVGEDELLMVEDMEIYPIAEVTFPGDYSV